jgi:two-component system, NarL family, nitrate/nitrite response regulator NarL
MTYTSAPIQVIIADDHCIFRQGLKAALLNHKDICLVGEASNGKELYQLVEKKAPEVILTDISMPKLTGIEVTKIIKEKHPKIKVIILSMYEEIALIKEAFQAGANGYLSKNAAVDEIVFAIKEVLKEKPYFGSDTSNKFFEILKHGLHPSALTSREIEIIRLLYEELTNHEIGEKLSISERTVEDHRKKIAEKIGAKNVVGIIKYALRNKIIKS